MDGYLEHICGFDFPLSPQFCLLEAANAVVRPTLKVPASEMVL